jgi:hypothetical protein
MPWGYPGAPSEPAPPAEMGRSADEGRVDGAGDGVTVAPSVTA